MKSLSAWLNRRLSIVIALVSVGVLILMILQMSNVSEQAKVNAKLLQNQATLLQHINSDGDARSQAVDDLLKDNAAQTVILCKLILSSNLNFQDNDAAQIETICKQKIKAASDEAATATNTQLSPGSSTVTKPAEPSAITPVDKTPLPTPQPQSIIPGVSKPLVGCITSGVCI